MDLTIWKQAKKEQKLTIAEIAEKAKLPKGTVQNIFAGYIPNPRIDTVQAIEKALGLDGVTPEEYAAGWRNTATVQITPDEDDLLDKYKEIKQILGEKKGADLVKSLLDNLINSLK